MSPVSTKEKSGNKILFRIQTYSWYIPSGIWKKQKQIFLIIEIIPRYKGVTQFSMFFETMFSREIFSLRKIVINVLALEVKRMHCKRARKNYIFIQYRSIRCSNEFVTIMRHVCHGALSYSNKIYREIESLEYTTRYGGWNIFAKKNIP